MSLKSRQIVIIQNLTKVTDIKSTEMEI